MSGADLDINEVLRLSEEHLGPDEVSTRQGPSGVSLTYAEGHVIISQLNRIMKMGWSHKIQRLERLPDMQNGDPRYMCIVEITVPALGISHDGTGYGLGKGGDFEKAIKEAETDALKRAAKNFGNAFGASLYDKHHVQKLKSKSLSSTQTTHVQPYAGRTPLAAPTTAPSTRSFSPDYGRISHQRDAPFVAPSTTPASQPYIASKPYAPSQIVSRQETPLSEFHQF